MRRTAYNERLDRSSYLRVGKSRHSDPQANSFRVESSRLPEDNFVGPRTPHGYYQARGVRPLLHRPLTMQKTNPMFEHKRQGSQHTARQQYQRDLYVSTQRQHQKSDHFSYDHSKGKLFRGSSWRADEKMVKSIGTPNTSRYSSHKREIGQEMTEDEKRKKSSTLLDLIGQNLKKSELNAKQQDFFEYIMRFSYRTKKGYIPNNSGKVNQDSFIINPNINGKTWQHFFGVCDGHGPLGHHVSGFIKTALPSCLSSVKTLERFPKEGLNKAYEAAYEKLLRESNVDMSFSGSTVISCYLQQNKLLCANVGDSRAVLGRFKSNKWQAIPLSTDHKPTIQREADRIRKMKGRVEAFKDQYGEPIGPLRVWVQNDNVPGLAMTRSFGDLVGASVGVSPIPQIKQFSLSEQDRMIIIGSDGVFQFLQNQEVIKALVPFYETKQIQQASDHLMSLAIRSWNKHSSIVDDITFILIFISYNEV